MNLLVDELVGEISLRYQLDFVQRTRVQMRPDFAQDALHNVTPLRENGELPAEERRVQINIVYCGLRYQRRQIQEHFGVQSEVSRAQDLFGVGFKEEHNGAHAMSSRHGCNGEILVPLRDADGL